MAGRRSSLNEIEMDHFREWLEVLIKREKNQENAGKLLGVEQTTVSKLKGRDIQPSFERAHSLARALGTSIEVVLSQSPPKMPSDRPPPLPVISGVAETTGPPYGHPRRNPNEWLSLRLLIEEAATPYHTPADVMAVFDLGQQNTFHLQENEGTLLFVRALLNVAAELRLEGKEPVSGQAILARLASKTAERVPDSSRERKGQLRKQAPVPKRQGG